jgi:hypothetical protein
MKLGIHSEDLQDLNFASLDLMKNMRWRHLQWMMRLLQSALKGDCTEGLMKPNVMWFLKELKLS